MKITKRDGSKQELNLNKIHAVLIWACEGKDDEDLSPIKGVSVSEIEMKAQLHFYDGMPSKEIHETLIKAASDLISEDYPNYDQVAARLVWFSVRKEAFRQNLPISLKELVHRNIKIGVYSKDITDLYTDEELDELDKLIVHKRDDLFKYAGAEQMRKKYLAQNRKTKEIYESFQFPYILVSAILFAKYNKNVRMKYVKKYYDMISQHYISLPTPIMAGLRTNEKQYSSCTKIEAGDSLNSIKAASNAIIDYASNRAGIGLNIGGIRAIGQSIRNGAAVTTGILPFAKLFNASLKSCSQGGVRGASGTFNYPIWHLEFETLIELKNNKGTEETRLRTVDYCVHINKLFYERLVENKKITFFSPNEVPDLYNAFYSNDYENFKTLYEKYEHSNNVSKKQAPAIDVFTKLMQERFETGRIYILHADHVNSHSSFYEPIKMTNLCCEITLPTTPMGDENSLIALCTLSAINWGKFMPFSEIDKESSAYQKQEDRLRDCCEMAVRGLDALLDYQNYPRKEAERHTKLYRPLGIGIIGFAHWLAKGKLYWGESKTIEDVETMTEKMAYYLTETSIQLAKEFGACTKTKYHDGIFPKDTSIVKPNLKMDWNILKEKVLKYGIRNATLMAGMPSETSSQLANETNGIEAPKDLLSIKGSKEGVLPQIVPEYNKLSAFYQKAWEVSTKNYFKTIAPIQIYFDQAISLNSSYDPSKQPIKMSLLIEDLLYAYKNGHKTLYYNNVRDGGGDDDEGCGSDGCKI